MRTSGPDKIGVGVVTKMHIYIHTHTDEKYLLVALLGCGCVGSVRQVCMDAELR